MLSKTYSTLANYNGLIGNTFIIKTNSSGHMEWNKTFSPVGYSDTPFAISKTVDGGYAITGTTLTGSVTIWDYSNFNQTGTGIPVVYLTNPGVFLLKINGTGFKEWGRFFAYTNTTAKAMAVTQTTDGGYAIAGEYKNNTSGRTCALIIKTDLTGVHQFAYYYDESEGNSFASSIALTCDGNFIVTGGKNSSLGDYDTYLLKTADNGNIIWSKTIGGSANETGKRVIETVDSGYAIIGSTSSQNQNSDFLLTKTDADGNLQWNKTYGDLNNDYGYSIIQDVDEGYAITGATNSTGNQDSLLIKTNSFGNQMWNITQGNSTNDYTNSIVQADDRGYTMAGFSSEKSWLIKVAAGQDTLPSGPQSWAVIVGTSTYPYLSNSSQLTYCDDDARSLYNQLAPIYGVDHIKLLIDRNATKGAILNAVTEWLSVREDSEDTVLFYFSGHGGYGSDLAPKDELDNYDEYICPANSLPTYWTNDIRDDEFTQWINKLNTEKMVTILDTCFSGGFINRSTVLTKSINDKTMDTASFLDIVDLTDIFTKDLSKSGRVVLTASTEDETSMELGSLGHGLFTYYIIAALNNLRVIDVNQNYDVSAEEIFNYANTNVELYLNGTGISQTPVMYDGYPGELPLVNYAPVYSFSIASDHGSPSPTAEIHRYTNGTIVYCSVVSPVTEGDTIWTCTGWTGTGSVSSGSGTSTSVTITQNSSLIWNWKSTFIITPSAGTGGSISPNIPQTVLYGDTPSFTITPSTGYDTLDVKVNDTSVLTQMVGEVYAFAAINANYAITATFTIEPTPTPTSTSSNSGSSSSSSASSSSSSSHSSSGSSSSSSPSSASPTNTSPTPTPSVPELSTILLLPMLALVLFSAVAIKLRKQTAKS